MSDDRLRAALLDLGDVPPPPDLAGAALARARRNRRRAITGLVAVVAIVAAAAVTVPTVLLRRPTTTQTATEPVTGLMIAGYGSVVDPYNGTIPKVATGGSWHPGDGPMLYSRSRGGYSAPPWQIAVPSPDGRLVAVSEAGVTPGPHGDVAKAGRIGIVPADRVDDPAAVRWVPDLDTYGNLRWEPDSRHLDVQPNDFPSGRRPGLYFERVDVTTLQRTAVILVTRADEISAALPVVPRNGRGFATTVSLPQPGGGGVTRWTLRYYDERDEGIREVTIVGTPDLPSLVAQPFSPDGSMVAMAGGDRTDIADTSTGRVVQRAVDGVFAGWYDDERFVVWINRAVRVVDLHTGRVVAEKVIVPAYRKLTAVWLAPVHGTPPPGAIVL